MALKFNYANDQRDVGVSFCDTNKRTIVMAQFLDNEQFSELETFITQAGAKQCFMHIDEKKNPDFKKIKDVMERFNVMITEVAKSM